MMIDDNINDNNKEKGVSNTTTNNATEQMNSTELLPARDTQYNDYFIGTTTINSMRPTNTKKMIFGKREGIHSYRNQIA